MQSANKIFLSRSSTGNSGTRPLFKLHWLAFNVASAYVLFNAIIFWALHFPSLDGSVMRFATWYDLVLGVHTHAIVVVLVVVDVLVSGVVVRFWHVCHAKFATLVYVAFSYLYPLIGNNNADEPFIYAWLDWWQDPVRAVVVSVLGCIVAVPLAWLVLVYGTARLRSAALASRSPKAEANDAEAAMSDMNEETAADAAEPVTADKGDATPDSAAEKPAAE